MHKSNLRDALDGDIQLLHSPYNVSCLIYRGAEPPCLLLDGRSACSHVCRVVQSVPLQLGEADRWVLQVIEQNLDLGWERNKITLFMAMKSLIIITT